MQVALCGHAMKNPVIAASGTFGFGEAYTDYFDPSVLGGICSKGLTLHPQAGNPGRRLHETPSGLINSIGLQNPGVSHFIEHEWEQMRAIDTLSVVNLGGHSIDDYVEGAHLLNETDAPVIELNISCPNVAEGGMAFGLLCESADLVVRAVRNATKKTLMVKLSPNAENIVEMAKACEAAGADAVSLVNTFQAMAVDIHARKPVFERVYAGLSGPAIFPMALRMVHQVARAVSIPVVGLGGIASGEDALAMMMAGAQAVQVGTAQFTHPRKLLQILEEMEAFCRAEGISSIQDIVGIV